MLHCSCPQFSARKRKYCIDCHQQCRNTVFANFWLAYLFFLEIPDVSEKAGEHNRNSDLQWKLKAVRKQPSTDCLWGTRTPRKRSLRRVFPHFRFISLVHSLVSCKNRKPLSESAVCFPTYEAGRFMLFALLHTSRHRYPLTGIQVWRALFSPSFSATKFFFSSFSCHRRLWFSSRVPKGPWRWFSTLQAWPSCWKSIFTHWLVWSTKEDDFSWKRAPTMRCDLRIYCRVQ